MVGERRSRRQGDSDRHCQGQQRTASARASSNHQDRSILDRLTLDDATVEELRRTAARLKKPQSQVVREAVAEYSARADKLTERERTRILAVIERLKRARPTRSQAENDAEVAEIRAVRRLGGRRHPAE
jgi:propanediol dehydratase small subunit